MRVIGRGECMVEKPNGGPPKNEEHAALWRLIDWLADETRDIRGESRSFRLWVIGLMVTMLGLHAAVLSVVLLRGS